MITFPCPECGRKLHVADEHAGRKCRCPQCQQKVRAPVARQVTRAREETETQPPIATPVKPGAAWPTVPDYELLEVIGQGGMGQVFRARHVPLDRPVALKVIRPDRLEDGNPQVIRRFLHEIRAAARFDHPYLIKVFDAGSAGDVHYLSMELIDGIDLSRLVKRDGPLPVDRTVRYLRQAAEGLAYAHNMGLVHRDIKPHNMLLETKSDRIKILDLGLARVRTTSDGSHSSITESGAMMGTLDYMAPEQGRDPKGVDGRADLYSLGCTAYMLLTGRPPFAGETQTAVLLAHQMDVPEPLQARRPDVPPLLAAVVARLLAKKPDDRYATGTELVAALGQLGSAGSVVVMPAVPPAAPAPVAPPPVQHRLPETVTYPPTRRPQQQRVGLWVLAGLAALALFLAVLAYAILSGRRGPAAGSTQRAGDQPPVLLPPVFQPLPGKTYHTNSVGMVLVKVPAGSYWYGGGGGKAGTQHITLDRDFYLSVYEVTQAQWQAVIGTNPSHFTRTGIGSDMVKGVGDAELAQFPVEGVSWEACQNFLTRLSERELGTSGWTYRLPTDLEWEYAARAAASAKEDCDFDFYLAGGPTNVLTADQANFVESKFDRPVSVGRYPPNVLGLYDMHGNVWEWCSDLFGKGPARVNRGGSWGSSAANCRAATRTSNTPANGYSNLGLRAVGVPPGN